MTVALVVHLESMGVSPAQGLLHHLRYELGSASGSFIGFPPLPPPTI